MKVKLLNNIPNKLQSAKYIYLFFVVNLLLSFLYTLFKGRFNGDFLGVEVLLPQWLLWLNLVLSFLPFYFLWKIYKFYKKRTPQKTVKLNLKVFGWLTLFFLLLNILTTLFFGVGIMAAPAYQAPPIIKFFIQLINRFNCSYAVLLYFLASDKKDRMQIILLLFLFILSFFRAGLGVLLYIFMFSVVKYFDEIVQFVKKYKLPILLMIFLLPALIGFLFNMRSILRNGEVEDIAGIDLMVGRLSGRLSSFSDSAFIIQETPYFLLNVQYMDPLYFQKQMLSGVISMDFLPNPRPEKLLFDFYYESSSDNVAYMAGTQGNLIISFLKSPNVFLLNLLTIIATIIATFKISRLLRFTYANEYAFLLLTYVILSGVANEYAFVLFSVLSFFLIFFILNLIHKKAK